MTVENNLFVNAMMRNALDMTETQNGALANATTHSACLDMFSSMGNYHALDIHAFEILFENAINENPLIAMRLLFHNRDVRGGQKVRKYFQHILHTYTQKDERFAAWLRENLLLIPEYGYWKDLYVLYGTELWSDVVKLWVQQLFADEHAMRTGNGQVSLAAKYAPTESQKGTINNNKYKEEFLTYFVSPKDYRVLISHLRSHLRIVEKQMSRNAWGDIEYSHVPSVAFMRYRNAFTRHDQERFQDFLHSGRKVNASALTPVDVCRQYYRNLKGGEDQALETIWRNLDDVFVVLPDMRLLPICDCSGSMGDIDYLIDGYIQPIEVATALTIYCAERNRGVFRNVFMEFSHTAKFYKLPNGSLYDKIQFVASKNEVANTNLQAVFDLILRLAVDNNVPQADMPTHLIIFSDMQFDVATQENDQRNLDVIKQKYQQAGYECPQIIFWDLYRSNNFAATRFDHDVSLVSGYSEQLLKYIFCGVSIPTPYDVMMQVVNSERYSPINY